ncbi:MAG: GAF domain-containing protein [Acidobacteriota bacterium]|nr:MAG: GAF domain-containing protein [Acidobacteriota bacterium]
MSQTKASSEKRLAERYERIASQLFALFGKTEDPIARMATAAAVLHHKMPHYFWTGFYRLVNGDLIVGPYQGALACQVLERGVGVCWAAVEREEPVLVADVHAFEGHIACDPRSKSEVVVPVRDRNENVVAVLDVDSEKPDAFSRADVEGLTSIAGQIYAPLDL